VYTASTDWVWASPQKGGRQPLWLATVMRYYIQPAARRAGITKKIGWHTSLRCSTPAQTMIHSRYKLLWSDAERAEYAKVIYGHDNIDILLCIARHLYYSPPVPSFPVRQLREYGKSRLKVKTKCGFILKQDNDCVQVRINFDSFHDLAFDFAKVSELSWALFP
jgi:hypothetical protein